MKHMTDGYARRKITAPAMKHRNGWKAPKTELHVYISGAVVIPWSEMRPLIACAFRHVQRVAFDDRQLEYINRCQRNPTQLFLNASHHHTGGWWGRNMGNRSRVFIGKLVNYPESAVYPKFKDMPTFWHANWQEHLVGIVAHELWHRWQGGHGREAEFMCETVEIDAIDQYRKEQKYTFTPPPQVELEPDDFKHCPAEDCTDCHRPTRYWLPGGQVTLCPDCNNKRNRNYDGRTFLKKEVSVSPNPVPSISRDQS